MADLHPQCDKHFCNFNPWSDSFQILTSSPSLGQSSCHCSEHSHSGAGCIHKPSRAQNPIDNFPGSCKSGMDCYLHPHGFFPEFSMGIFPSSEGLESPQCLGVTQNWLLCLQKKMSGSGPARTSDVVLDDFLWKIFFYSPVNMAMEKSPIFSRKYESIKGPFSSQLC